MGKTRQTEARLSKDVVQSPQGEVEFDFGDPEEMRPETTTDDKRVFSSFISIQDLED